MKFGVLALDYDGTLARELKTQYRLKHHLSRWHRYSPVSTNSPLFELTRMLVRLDHVARRIVNPNHGIK